MKNRFYLLLVSIVLVALAWRSLFLYDMFHGIDTITNWRIQDCGKGFSRLDLFDYGPTFLLIIVFSIFLLKFRKDEKLYNSKFFVFLLIVTIPEMLLSLLLFSMSGPIPIL